MSKFTFVTSFSETELDENNDVVASHYFDLPHHKQIVKSACDDWNNAHMEQYYDGFLKDKVESAKMSSCRDISGSNRCLVKIEVVLKPSIRMTAKRRMEIEHQTSAQMTDGWGEGFFGYDNIMTDGKSRFIAE